MIKNTLRIPSIILFSLIALYSCVLTPLREYLATDFVLSDTVWFAIVDLCWMHLNVIASVALPVFVIFGIYRYGLRDSKQVLLLALGALLLKYVAATVAVSIEYGSLDLTGGLVAFVVNLLIEIALVALISFLTHRFVSVHQLRYEERKAAAKQLGRPFEEKPIYPFQHVFSRKNPLQRMFFICTLAVALIQILADIPQTFEFGIFGAADILIAVLSWIVLILLPAFYSYFLSLLFFKLCSKQAQKEDARVQE
jgi:hypothetical protein